ncbi:hypothetical protein EZJ55_05875 [Microcystis aeruginosa EAWAG127a]|uniref:Uncharacterized protein n=1 Tax=Microcystis aeruginosa EAWAG127a TaxID=2529855 RepID=A0A5J5LRX6_MICAE|nr:hypothetical protein EZJ55_05875 [Microcystis aeruginosa EAWAG127a]
MALVGECLSLVVGVRGVFSYQLSVGFHTSTQPCILREVVDRPNLGQKRPLRSKGHHHNLPDKTRTVAGVVAKTINF